MNELIAVAERNIGETLIQTVNARELHGFLGNRDRFATWIADRIRQYDFAENIDFVTYSGNSEKGRPAKEYAISLDMAKELAMVERNEKGKQARRYFIECERKAHSVTDPMVALNDPAAMRGILLSYTEKVLELQGEVEEMRPQVQALERIAISDGSMCITDAAKTLQVQPKALFGFLRAHGWIYTRQGSNEYIAYQSKLQSGLLEHKTTVVTRSDGSEKTTTQVRVTPKGLTRLAKEFQPVARAA
ncbi:phage antirepressor KilAC domain-containing protein [Sphingobium sp. CFD-1]|uniref:phage antirepressor KilAC domain-containing protein n=1 Tax=Sphingobium sp. CFD-1 TaxID=2878545 RepID=UPI00214BC5C2|nr:phage antirepressor KilAC domain-containing protein [Sphingobium sp. CFD-1]